MSLIIISELTSIHVPWLPQLHYQSYTKLFFSYRVTHILSGVFCTFTAISATRGQNGDKERRCRSWCSNASGCRQRSDWVRFYKFENSETNHSIAVSNFFFHFSLTFIVIRRRAKKFSTQHTLDFLLADFPVWPLSF